jgi:hypothetical protein
VAHTQAQLFLQVHAELDGCWVADCCPLTWLSAVTAVAQDAVSLCDESGHEFARGLSNFDSKVCDCLLQCHPAAHCTSQLSLYTAACLSVCNH